MSNFISSQNIIIDVIDESTPNVKYSHTCLKHFHTETKGYPAYLFMQTPFLNDYDRIFTV